jgi:hypothetical protein
MNITKIDPDFTPETHDVGSNSAQSGVITTGSGLIRICTTTHCHIKFGATSYCHSNYRSFAIPPNTC